MGTILGSIMKNLSSGAPKKLLMLGLDAAGKTTMLYKLKLDKTIKPFPTIGFNLE